MSTQTNNPVAKAVRWALFAGAAAAVATPMIASAADEDVERIEVTGSRIKRTDIEGANPVLSISRADIDLTGATNLGELMQRIPAAGTALNRNFNNGGDGTIRLDLRNLGSNRLLVLVNGRRWVNGGSGADSSVDMNTIPLSIVERVEVLKDGASAVYGSDAIAGVVNIITRKDFEGVQISGQTGQYEHGDGDSNQIDLTMGTSSEKGNVTAGLSWNEDKPVWAGDRIFSSKGATPKAHSSYTPNGRFYGLDNFGVAGATQTLVAPCGATCSAADYRAFNDPLNYGSSPESDRYNFNPDNYVLTPSERRGMFISGNYSLSDSVRVYAEGSYVNRTSDQSLAPIPVAFGAAQGDPTVISESNPYNWTGEDFGDDIKEGLLRRMVEAGRRRYLQEVNTYRFATGFTGEFGNGWSWDANYIYGKNQTTTTQGGQLNTTKIQNALGPAYDRGDHTYGCGVDAAHEIAGCVPLNLFGGAGSITPEMLDYISFTGHDSGGNEMEELSANITGDLFDLPAGPLGFAGGVSRREEQGFDSPDALVASGETTGNARKPTSGHFSLKEAYVEFNVPLISDVAFADSVELSIASRYSDYDTFGSTTNSKVGLQWRINPELMLRSTWSEGFRAPSIFELFGGTGDDYPQIQDPCDATTRNPDVRNPGSIAACNAAGVPPGFVQPNPQIRTTTGSNANLSPETSESFTAGLVYSPSWYEGSSLTVDWYKIRVANNVTRLGAQTILNSCYNSDGKGSRYCELIDRASNGFITDLRDVNINAGRVTVGGVDMNFSTPSHETFLGSFKYTLEASYVDQYDQVDAIGEEAGYAGVIFPSSRGGNIPRWKANGTLTWNYGDWSASWTSRYFHNVKNDDDGSRLGGVVFNDMQVSYNLADYKTSLTLGIDNVLDKDPPFTGTAFANNFDPSYTMPGPYGYVRVVTKF